MKSQCEVLKKISQLIQSHIATATGQERFVAAECGGDGIIVTAQDDSGIRRQFKLTAEELTNEPPTAMCGQAPANTDDQCTGEESAEASPPEAEASQDEAVAEPTPAATPSA